MKFAKCIILDSKEDLRKSHHEEIATAEVIISVKDNEVLKNRFCNVGVIEKETNKMGRCIWKIEKKLPELKAGMVVKYDENTESAYLLLNCMNDYRFCRTVNLNNLSSDSCDYAWPDTLENKHRITKIWASIDDYYKDKFNV